ncbi:MAG: hypothetical protein KC940_23710 [Candidatus Omnitrophica bacterium]|nr:hypothetical protein [Candidatus Omnitrophota bacterium]
MMRKETFTEEDPGSRFMSGIAGSVFIATGLALCPPLALVGGLLLMLARNRSVEEIGREMDTEEMTDTEDLASSWLDNKGEDESLISITRSREAGGFLPMDVNRTHVFFDEPSMEDVWKDNWYRPKFP